jgi:hypothetical protein
VTTNIFVLTDVSADINACLTEAESCITLLLQSVGLFDIDDLHSSEPFVNSAEKIAVITAPVETCEAVKQYSAITCSSPRQIYSDTTSDEACHTVSFKTSLSSGNSNSTEDQPDLAGGVLSGSSGIEHNGESSVNVLSSAESSKYPADYLFTSSTDDNIRKEEVRHHGLLAFGPSMHISVSREIGIQETDDNVELIQNLHDQWSLLTNRYLPAVKKWLDVRKCLHCLSYLVMSNSNL